MPAFENGLDQMKGWVDVELAGTSKRFETIYKLQKLATVIQLRGERASVFRILLSRRLKKCIV